VRGLRARLTVPRPGTIRGVNRLLSRRGVPALIALVVLLGAGVAVAAGAFGGDEEDPADRAFSALCRERGGTPTLAPGSGDYVKDARSCEIRYARHTYEMYAITPNGFDERAAARARESCTVRARQEKGLPGAPKRRVWHPRSAICEAVD
jgi:hypothetical protein